MRNSRQRDTEALYTSHIIPPPPPPPPRRSGWNFGLLGLNGMASSDQIKYIVLLCTIGIGVISVSSLFIKGARRKIQT